MVIRLVDMSLVLDIFHPSSYMLPVLVICHLSWLSSTSPGYLSSILVICHPSWLSVIRPGYLSSVLVICHLPGYLPLIGHLWSVLFSIEALAA